MSKFYHVTEKWDGASLQSLYQAEGEKAYEMYAEKWPEAGELAQYHAHVIHLYATVEEAQQHIDLWDGHEILVINDQDDELDIVEDDLEFPHPVCRNEIPAEMITKL